MEFRLLGPVELRSSDRQVRLGSAKERCVLAVLLMHTGRLVPAGDLIDHVWGEQLPARPDKTLHECISRLRRALSDASDGTAPAELRQRASGYELRIASTSIDLHRFRKTVQKSSEARAKGRAAKAAGLLRRADELWRGEPLAGLTGDWADRMRRLLQAERDAARADRIDADLDAGRHADLLGELPGLVAQNGMDERLVGQLMRALYAAGRQQAALDCYQELRQRLVDDGGHDPGPELANLHQRILRRDPELVGRPPRHRAATTTTRAKTVRAGGGIRFAGPVSIQGDVVAGDKIVHRD